MAKKRFHGMAAERSEREDRAYIEVLYNPLATRTTTDSAAGTVALFFIEPDLDSLPSGAATTRSS